MEEQLIDNEFSESRKDVPLGIMRWWEKKRLIFNSINVGIVILLVIIHLIEHPNSASYTFIGGLLSMSLFHFLFINVCYCAGWVIQLLVYYYFKIQFDDSKYLDYFLFIVGSLITGLVTYSKYLEVLPYGTHL